MQRLTAANHVTSMHWSPQADRRPVTDPSAVDHLGRLLTRQSEQTARSEGRAVGGAPCQTPRFARVALADLTDRLTSDRSVRQGVVMVRRTGADTKQEILNAATRLFGDFGYRGTSLADIAHEIGYSKASVLYHFASKEALLAELIAPAAADLQALLARVSALPLAQARRSAIEGYADLTVTHKETVAVLQTEEPLFPQDSHFRLYERLVEVLQGKDPSAQARVAAIMVVVGIAAAVSYTHLRAHETV